MKMAYATCYKHVGHDISFNRNARLLESFPDHSVLGIILKLVVLKDVAREERLYVHDVLG